MTETPHASLARVTGARKGVIADASVDDEFAVAMLHALEQRTGRANQARPDSAAPHAGVRRAFAERARWRPIASRSNRATRRSLSAIG